MFYFVIDENSTFSTKSKVFYPPRVSKCFAHWITVNYREAYGIYACNGILFNHESPSRGETFVSRKITRALARIKFGLQDCLYLGNLNALRDWGHAKDYVNAMWLMLQKNRPEDYVISTGKQHSVEDFAKLAFAEVGLDYKKFIEVDKKLYRPSEVDSLLGNCKKAKTKLNWKLLFFLSFGTSFLQKRK